MDELITNAVQIYKFPVHDEKEAEINSSMNVSCSISLLQVVIILMAVIIASVFVLHMHKSSVNYFK